jgi:hypothetical protein
VAELRGFHAEIRALATPPPEEAIDLLLLCEPVSAEETDPEQAP